MNRRAVAVCAHPDDLEFFCGGAVTAMIVDGWEVSLVIATDGQKGAVDPAISSEVLASQRRAEARDAAELLGLANVVFLGHEDGELRCTPDLRRELAGIYRRLCPDLLLTFDPWRRYELHPDHREIGFAALDARLAAKLPLYFPEQLRDGLRTWAVTQLLLFNTDDPDDFMDITTTFDAKAAALRRHRSQWEAIWEETYRALVEEATKMGARAGFKYAEGFKRILIPGATVSSRFGAEKGD
ncbi:MAG: PIG-L deacetylase family protein [Clostridia bacterium]|nr:PIG-L deacetylase family protein [Clostridia bacterium]